MLIGIKNAAKLIGISIIACCAVLVCTMFLNFYFDVQSIESEITSELSLIYYNAQVSTAKVVCLVSGGCLLITSAVMLMFYIKHYIDTHKKELGILKALGYSNLKIAKSFWVFGISAFIGTVIGFGGAFLLMPWLYALQNKDKILPEIAINFHPIIFLYFVILPTVGFSLLAISYAWCKLKRPVLSLLKEDFKSLAKVKKHKKDKHSEYSFVDDLKRNTLKSKKVLVFFIIFASFSFSAMTQMSFSMKDLSSEMMGAMILIIGLVLAFTTMFLAITTVINGNTRTIAMMQVFGYSQKDCCKAILSGYRPMSYIGFAIGTVYQYVLLRIMVDIVFKDFEGMPIYEFDFPVMIISLVAFILIYEILMYVYSERIKKISIKEIMIE
ncbi:MULTISPECIES: ABC transporter permease [unclassified Ruminococcus]|uniref:ABC transporter permease n=1 Tax=unclassified Ruminococcus TaxID=2608920 RepID=UPI00210E2601|nr:MULTISPECIES: ABC transporter permease [unclassified Ruminococcus]MCQ4022446.1 FtsX-like permease family protein [Ruminococcus sp. zg-924]MCQ4114774.1 FtsX-like permease family protein [Ruminococcus sp. zg-921]